MKRFGVSRGPSFKPVIWLSIYRLILKAQKIRERLRGSLGVIGPFPAKPKGMHWRRYDRLRRSHDQAVNDSLMTLKGYVKRLHESLS